MGQWQAGRPVLQAAEGDQQLLPELGYQGQGDASEARALEQLQDIVRQEFEDDALVVVMHKGVQNLHYSRIWSGQRSQNFNLDLGLIEESAFTLDDFDRTVHLLLPIKRFHDAAKRALANYYLDHVAIVEFFGRLDQIIVVGVVIPVVFTWFLGASLLLLDRALLLSVI